MAEGERPCHAVAINFCTDDRGKVTFHWFISEERARDLLTELTDRLGPPGDEFYAPAEAIDMVQRELFSKPGVIHAPREDAGDD